ncbi:MAG: DUF805 domain-containing protein [Pseudomonadota bacterium]
MDTTLSDAMQAAPAGASYQPSMLAVNGRIGRLRYFTFSCVLAVAVMLVAVTSFLLFSPGMAMLVLAISYLAFIPASFVLMIRRLNDLDRSGWCSLAALVPFVNLALGLYATFARGSAGPNRFGPAPVANSRALVMAAIGVLPAAFAIGLAAGMMGVSFRALA